MKDHLGPSTPFIVGAPLGDNNSPVWVMTIDHYGPTSVRNCNISFWDVARKNIEYGWLAHHPGVLYPPDRLSNTQREFAVHEAGPIPGFVIGGHFQWIPLNPDHQHYMVAVTCPDEGQFYEDWRIERTNRQLLTKLRLSISGRGVNDQHPSPSDIIFQCSDTGFPATEPQPIPPPASVPVPYFGWQLDHIYTPPLYIIDPNNNYELLQTKNDCWADFDRHQGDATLPFAWPNDMPAENRIIWVALVIFALVSLAGLYSLFALWWMDASDFILPQRNEHGSRDDIRHTSGNKNVAIRRVRETP